MTKKIYSSWQKISFWNKVKLTLVACGAGGEITVLVNDSYPWWHAVVVGCTVLAFIITNFVQDLNNNGIIDFFEKEEKKEDQL